MKKEFALILLLTLFSTNAFSGWSSQGVIDDLRIIGGNKVYGKLEGIVLSCGNSDFRIDLSVDLAKEVYSTMLAAVISNRTVTLYETGSCDSSNRTMVSGINLL